MPQVFRCAQRAKRRPSRPPATTSGRPAARAPPELAESELLGEISEIHTGSDDSYGSPRVTRRLRSRGRSVNYQRVERLMRLHELVGISERRRVRTTIRTEDAQPLPDLVERRFAPREPDVALVGDITYIRPGGMALPLERPRPGQPTSDRLEDGRQHGHVAPRRRARGGS